VFSPCFNGFSHRVDEIWIWSMPLGHLIASRVQRVDKLTQVLTGLVWYKLFEHDILLYFLQPTCPYFYCAPCEPKKDKRRTCCACGYTGICVVYRHKTCALLTVLTWSRTRPIFLGGYTTSEPLFDPKLCLFSVVRLLQQRSPPVIWSFVTTPTSPSAFLPDPGKRGNPNRHRMTF